MDPDWRYISYWKWGCHSSQLCIAMLVYQRVGIAKFPVFAPHLRQNLQEFHGISWSWVASTGGKCLIFPAHSLRSNDEATLNQSLRILMKTKLSPNWQDKDLLLLPIGQAECALDLWLLWTYLLHTPSVLSCKTCFPKTWKNARTRPKFPTDSENTDTHTP